MSSAEFLLALSRAGDKVKRQQSRDCLFFDFCGYIRYQKTAERIDSR